MTVAPFSLKHHIASGVIKAELVEKVCDDKNISVNALLLELISLVKHRAHPATSGFKVGAAGVGKSGNVYLGVNVEFDHADVSQTIHAEQCTVVNAFNHGETSLLVLAVSAPPCGFCRQFLYELNSADDLEIILADSDPMKIKDLLPRPFGPQDLGIKGGLLSPQQHKLKIDSAQLGPLFDRAFECAKVSYAPYTDAFSGASLSLNNGDIIGGSYIENAAFNPTISPLKSALSQTIIAGHSFDDVAHACIAQMQNSKIDHLGNAKELSRCLPNISQIEHIYLS